MQEVRRIRERAGMNALFFNFSEGHSVDRESSKAHPSKAVSVARLSQPGRRACEVLQRALSHSRLESTPSKQRRLPPVRTKGPAEARPSEGQQGENTQWKS